MIDTNCRNCGAPIDNGKCRYCGTRNTFSGIYRKTASNVSVDLSLKTKVIIGAFALLLPYYLLRKQLKK